MSLGNSLYNARKKSGLSQEEVAGKLGVSRQTVSKWETDETLPDIRQSKNLVIENTSEEMQNKIDWTKVWGKKYPILSTYQKEVQIRGYAEQLKAMLDRLKRDYGYNDTDAFLVLKDIMSSVWKQKK